MRGGVLEVSTVRIAGIAVRRATTAPAETPPDRTRDG